MATQGGRGGDIRSVGKGLKSTQTGGREALNAYPAGKHRSMTERITYSLRHEVRALPEPRPAAFHHIVIAGTASQRSVSSD